jgi:hypothetical protein
MYADKTVNLLGKIERVTGKAVTQRISIRDLEWEGYASA